MLINYSNHPYKYWPDSQVEAANQWGTIIDIPFPMVDPSLGKREIEQLADLEINRILEHSPEVCPTILIMGEPTFTFAMVIKLKQRGITCIASTTERLTSYDNDGNKISSYRFVRFREY